MPSFSASGAGTCRPEVIISSAVFAPTKRGNRCVPPPPGRMPISTSGSPTFAAGTAMDEAARAQGFYVLYPAQAQSANPQRCWNWFKHNHQQRGKGEPALLAGMTHDVMARHAIDPRRVLR